MNRRRLNQLLLSTTAIVSLVGQALARGTGRHGGGAGGPPPQIISSLTVAGSSTAASFAASTPSAVVGTVVVTMSPASPAFSGAISLDGGGHNTEGFTLTGSTSGSSLLAPSLALGAYTDVVIRASQAPLTDLTINPTLTAISSSNPTNVAGPYFPQQPYNSVMGGQLVIAASPILNSTTTSEAYLVSGTVSLTFSGATTGYITAQWMLDNNPLGPQVTGPPGTYSWDTTTATDGTHCLWLQVLDSNPATGVAAYAYGTTPRSTTVLNGSPSGISPSVTQTVAVASQGAASVFGVFPSRPDYITYPGSPSLVASTVFPTNWGQAVPPAFSDSRYMGANAANLRDPNLWYAEPGNEYRWHQYQYTPGFRTLQTGGVANKGVFVARFDPQVGGLAISTAYDFIIRANAWDGGRLNNLCTPWAEFEEIPPGSSLGAGTGFLGIEINGRLVKYLWDGSATTVFGFKADRTQLSVDFTDLTWPEGSITRTTVGTCSGFDDLGGAGDLCFDPDSPDIVYVAVTTHNFIAAVNVSSGTINGIPALTAVIYAGADVADAYVDNATAANARFAQPSGMCIVPTSGGVYPKGTIFIADTNNNACRAIARTSPGVAGAVTTIMGGSLVSQPSFPTYAANFSTYCPASTAFTGSYIQGPNKVAITSTNGFVFVETWNNAVRYANLTGNLVTICGVYGGGPAQPSGGGGGPGGFTWLDCDYTGACGPVDDIIMLQITAASGHDTYRVALNGSYQATWIASPDQTSLRQGAAVSIAQGMGHYSWGITFARTQGRMIGNGIGTPNNMVFRIAFQSGVNGSTITDPLDGTNDNFAGAGFESWMGGTCAIEVVSGGVGSTPLVFPYNSRPSFYNLLGTGSCNLGAFLYNSFDEINASLSDGNYDLHPGDPANAGTLTAYIQAGLGGAVPRPEFTGRSLRDLIYWIRRGSNAGSWPAIVALGPTNPDVTPPVISNVSINHSGSSLIATWDTNKPTYGGLAVGTPNQQGFAGQNRAYNMWAFESFTPGVASYKTTGHTATVTNLPTGITPLHWTITAKDIAGNSSYIVDQSVA